LHNKEGMFACHVKLRYKLTQLSGSSGHSCRRNRLSSLNRVIC